MDAAVKGSAAASLMPFISDGSWPPGLVRIFDIAARTMHGSFESRYYGAYNKLLTYCFGETFDFVVAPQAPPTEHSRETVDFVIYLTVFDIEQLPVFLVEVEDDHSRIRATKRKAADIQMRERYDDLLACPIPKLYGLSVLGTNMRVYCGEKAHNTTPATVTPPFVEASRDRVLPEDYLQDGWSVDISSPGGFLKMKHIVQFIQDASEQIRA